MDPSTIHTYKLIKKARNKDLRTKMKENIEVDLCKKHKIQSIHQIKDCDQLPITQP